MPNLRFPERQAASNSIAQEERDYFLFVGYHVGSYWERSTSHPRNGHSMEERFRGRNRLEVRHVLTYRDVRPEKLGVSRA